MELILSKPLHITTIAVRYTLAHYFHRYQRMTTLETSPRKIAAVRTTRNDATYCSDASRQDSQPMVENELTCCNQYPSLSSQGFKIGAFRGFRKIGFSEGSFSLNHAASASFSGNLRLISSTILFVALSVRLLLGMLQGCIVLCVTQCSPFPSFHLSVGVLLHARIA